MAAWQPVTAKSGNEVQYELYCGKQRGKKKAHGDFFVFSNNSSVCLVGKYLFKVNDNTRTKSKEVVLMSILSSLNRYFSCRCCSQLTLRRLTVILKFLKSRAFATLSSVITITSHLKGPPVFLTSFWLYYIWCFIRKFTLSLIFKLYSKPLY